MHLEILIDFSNKNCKGRVQGYVRNSHPKQLNNKFINLRILLLIDILIKGHL